MRRLVAYGALGLAAIAILIAVSSGGGDGYVIRVTLADAAGLRQNSPVMIGGVPAGTVQLHLWHGDQVIAELHINHTQSPVGRDASVAIAAVNFLGQKEAELTRGNAADPAPSGYTIPPSRVSVSTDLDQVLGVLDAGTRTRLAILIDEAGAALAGRRGDLHDVLGQLPPSLQRGTELLSQLAGDNHTLGHLVGTSDAFIAQVNGQRAQLSQLVDRAGQAAVSVTTRRAELTQTLASAPRTLATLRAFLAKLQATATPLGPAATDLASTAPVASAALAQVDPFVHAATPVFDRATAVAPSLSELADGATPVLRQASPTVSQLATFSQALAPVSGTLNHSVDNLLAVVDNWSRAIQFRDHLSHVFRGEASITPDVLTSLINRMLGPGAAAKPAKRSGRGVSAPSAAGSPASVLTPVRGAEPQSPRTRRRRHRHGHSTVTTAKQLLGRALAGVPPPGGAPPHLSPLLAPPVPDRAMSTITPPAPLPPAAPQPRAPPPRRRVRAPHRGQGLRRQRVVGVLIWLAISAYNGIPFASYSTALRVDPGGRQPAPARPGADRRCTCRPGPVQEHWLERPRSAQPPARPGRDRPGRHGRRGSRAGLLGPATSSSCPATATRCCRGSDDRRIGTRSPSACPRRSTRSTRRRAARSERWCATRCRASSAAGAGSTTRSGPRASDGPVPAARATFWRDPGRRSGYCPRSTG